MRHLGSILGTLLLFGVLLAPSLDAQQRRGQQPPPPAQAQPRPDTTTLVFERELFMYPDYQRRNPFRALSGMAETGPSFETLHLLGVISSPDPEMSVALLSVGPPPSSGRGTPGFETYRVRRGQSIGNARVLEIHRLRVVFEVEEFGVRERRTLEVMKPEDVPENVENVVSDTVIPRGQDPQGEVQIPGEGGSR
jgi:hypothetical protein